MNIIDKNGRLFGVINVIDLLVILFLVSLTPMFYFGYRLYAENKKTLAYLEAKEAEKKVEEAPAKEFYQVELNFRFDKLRPEVLNLISRGDTEVDQKGQVIGEVVSLDNPEPVIHEIVVSDTSKILQEDQVLKSIPAVLRLNAELKNNALYYKDQEIMLNSAIEFKTSKYQAEALFIGFGDKAIFTFTNVAAGKINVLYFSILTVVNKITELEKRIAALENIIAGSESISGLNKKNYFKDDGK